MSDSLKESAENHLRTIRNLMERATVYRALSSNTAIIGALFAFIVGGWMFTKGKDIHVEQYFWIWVVILLVIDGINTWQLWRDAKSRGVQFPSAGAVHCILAMLPGWLFGAMAGVIFIFLLEDPVSCSIFWTICAGMALAATGSFSPRSIVLLGWAMLLVGMGLWGWQMTGGQFPGETTSAQGAVVMIVAFGILPGIYGLMTKFIRKES